MTPNAISLFSNCGAGDLGFAAAGFRFSVMAELVESRLDVALLNHPGAVGVPGDLNVTWPQVVERWRDGRGSAPPALLAACPPCQGMSTARGRRGNEADPDAPGSRDLRNLLVLPIARVAEALRPSVVVVENVPAFLSRLVTDPATGCATSAATILIRLLGDRYDAYPFVADLADFGVPQTRKRCFVTFVRRDLAAARQLSKTGAAPYPVPKGAGDTALGTALESFELPSLDASATDTAQSSVHGMHFVPVWPPARYDMVAAVPPGSGASAWQNNDCPSCEAERIDAEAAVCPQCGETLPRPVIRDEFGSLRLINGFRRGSYRRMDPKRPAATITTASGRIGASRTIHPFQNRVLSPLECALLQTIPRDFDWGDTLQSCGVCELRAMIGEAVPPMFTEHHGEVLNDLLADPPVLKRAIRLPNERSAAASARLRRNAPDALADEPRRQLGVAL